MRTVAPITGICLQDAADLLGVSVRRVRQLIQENRIATHKISPRVRLAVVESVAAYAESDRRPGPKKATA